MNFHALALICQFSAGECIVNESPASPYLTKESCEQAISITAKEENFTEAAASYKVLTLSCLELPEGYDLEKNVLKLKNKILNITPGDGI